MKVGQEFSDGMFNYVIVDDGSGLKMVDAEGVVYDQPDDILKDMAQESGYFEVDPDLSAEAKLSRWILSMIKQ